jgi:hypothetical protein
MCGPIEFDLVAREGDSPRLSLMDIDEPDVRLDVTMRARVRSAMPLPVFLSGVGDCELTIDSQKSGSPDVSFEMSVISVESPGSEPTTLELSEIDNDLEAGDLSLGGGYACALAESTYLPLIISDVRAVLNTAFRDWLCSHCSCAG